MSPHAQPTHDTRANGPCAAFANGGPASPASAQAIREADQTWRTGPPGKPTAPSSSASPTDVSAAAPAGLWATMCIPPPPSSPRPSVSPAQGPREGGGADDVHKADLDNPWASHVAVARRNFSDKALEGFLCKIGSPAPVPPPLLPACARNSSWCQRALSGGICARPGRETGPHT